MALAAWVISLRAFSCALKKLKLAPRRPAHVQHPVRPGLDKSMGRYAAGLPRHRCTCPSVEVLMRMFLSGFGSGFGPGLDHGRKLAVG